MANVRAGFSWIAFLITYSRVHLLVGFLTIVQTLRAYGFIERAVFENLYLPDAKPIEFEE
jgi:hypothetical protein